MDGIEVWGKHSEYLYRVCYRECIPCLQAEQVSRGRVGLGIKDDGDIVVHTLTHPTLVLHNHCVTHLPLQAILTPDSRIAEGPNSRHGGRAPFQPARSVLLRRVHQNASCAVRASLAFRS